MGELGFLKLAYKTSLHIIQSYTAIDYAAQLAVSYKKTNTIKTSCSNTKPISIMHWPQIVFPGYQVTRQHVLVKHVS